MLQLQGQQAFTVEEAIDYGIKNSSSIKLNNIDIAIAEQDIKEYYAIGLPKLNGSVEYQHYLEIPTSFVPAEFFGGPAGTFAELQFGLPNSLAAGLSFSTLVFDGSFFTGIKAQKLYRELTRKSIDQTEFDIRKAVTEAYVNVLLGEENLKMLDKNIANLDQSMIETKAFFENGFVEKLDLDRLELSYDLLVSQKKSISRIVELGRTMLKFQMSFPLEKEINLSQTLDDVVDKVLIANIEKQAKVNYNKRPEYQTILLGQQLNAINLKATKNQRYPNIAGFANYNQQLQRTNLFASDEPGFTPISIIGLQMNIPIYNGGIVGIKSQKIKLDIEKTDIQKKEFERGVDLQVTSAYVQYLNAKESMYSAKRRQALAEEIYETTQIKYKEGVGSSIEKSTAEREVYSTQQQYVQSLYDLVSSKIALDIATGDISDKLY